MTQKSASLGEQRAQGGPKASTRLRDVQRLEKAGLSLPGCHLNRREHRRARMLQTRRVEARKNRKKG